MTYRSLVFDFDGTIADTLGETRRIFNQLAPEFGIRQVDESEVPQLRHLSLIELLDHLQIPKRRVPSLISRGTKMMRSNINELPLIHGMRDALLELRDHVDRFGILTSNTRENVEAFLHTHGLLDIFEFISSTSRLTGKAKHLKAIRTTFSLDPKQILYIGDELRDVLASQKAGIPVAAVTWGFNSPESLAAASPNHMIHHPSEFIRLFVR